MTEEQYKRCKEIYASCKSDYQCFPFLHIGHFIKITISLAKVFDKEITEEEAKEIAENISKKNTISSNPHTNTDATFRGIINYFYDGTTDGMTLNYLRDKNFKEIKKDNENNKENNK